MNVYTNVKTFDEVRRALQQIVAVLRDMSETDEFHGDQLEELQSVSTILGEDGAVILAEDGAPILAGARDPAEGAILAEDGAPMLNATGGMILAESGGYAAAIVRRQFEATRLGVWATSRPIPDLVPPRPLQENQNQQAAGD